MFKKYGMTEAKPAKCSYSYVCVYLVRIARWLILADIQETFAWHNSLANITNQLTAELTKTKLDRETFLACSICCYLEKLAQYINCLRGMSE